MEPSTPDRHKHSRGCRHETSLIIIISYHSIYINTSKMAHVSVKMDFSVQIKFYYAQINTIYFPHFTYILYALHKVPVGAVFTHLHTLYPSQSTPQPTMVPLHPVFKYPYTFYPSQSTPRPSVHVPTHFVPFTKYPSAQCSRTHTLCTLHKVPLGPVFTYPHTLYPSQSTPRPSVHIPTHFVPFTKYPVAQCSHTHTLCTLLRVPLGPVFTYPHTLYPSQSTPWPSVHVPTHFVPFTKYPSAQCSHTHTLCTLHRVPLSSVFTYPHTLYPSQSTPQLSVHVPLHFVPFTKYPSAECSRTHTLCTLHRVPLGPVFTYPYTLYPSQSTPRPSVHIPLHFVPFSEYPLAQCSHTHTLCTLHRVPLGPVSTYPHTLYPSQSTPRPSVHVPLHFVPFTEYPLAQCSHTHTLCTLHRVPLDPVFTYPHTLYPSQSTRQPSVHVPTHFVPFTRYPSCSRTLTLCTLHRVPLGAVAAVLCTVLLTGGCEFLFTLVYNYTRTHGEQCHNKHDHNEHYHN